MVMQMFKNIIVTDIDATLVVPIKREQRTTMTNRPYFGLAFCMSGQLSYRTDKKAYPLKEGIAVLLPQGENYTVVGEKDGLFPVVNFFCDGLDVGEITVIELENQKACLNGFEALQKLFMFGGDRLKSLSAFYELLSIVCPKKSLDSSHIKASLSYIEENLKNPELSNDMLAEMLGISEVYFRRLFAASFGVTPKQYILDLRIKKAKLLLRDTPLSVTEVAEECGFSSLYHFCRAFKSRTNLTPSEYSSQNRVYEI